jgi:23S rRNA-/tRNA-specific pseudouridylate synthase
MSQQLRPTNSSDSIRKTYLALVHGSLEPGDSGELRQNLYITDGRVTINNIPLKGRQLPTDARDTLTTWRCLSSNLFRDSVSLLELGLHTGVKHQLRVVTSSVLGGMCV